MEVKEMFKTPDGNPLIFRRSELKKECEHQIKFWKDFAKNETPEWKKESKENIEFWKYLLRQTNRKKIITTSVIDTQKDQGLKKAINMKDKVFKYLGKKITKGLSARGKTIYTIQGITVPQETLTNAKKSIIGDLAAGKVSVLKLKYLKEKVAKIKSLKDLQAEIVKINNAPKTMKNQGLKKPTVKGLKTVCSHVVKATGLKVDGTLKKGYKYISGGKIVKTAAATKKPVVKKKTAAKKKPAKKPVTNKKPATKKKAAKK